MDGSQGIHFQGIRSRKRDRHNASDQQLWNGLPPAVKRRTILSWLIDFRSLQVNQRVRYMDQTHSSEMLEGWIRRDGILCSCCSRVITVTEFEVHAGSDLCRPYENIYTEMGTSLLQCQIDVWGKQDESVRRGFHNVERKIDSGDQNDEICSICSIGGDLICCDGCPSTFHQSCLGILVW